MENGLLPRAACWSKGGDKSSTMWRHVFQFTWLFSEWPGQRLTIASTLSGLKGFPCRFLQEMNDSNIPFSYWTQIVSWPQRHQKEFSMIIHREYSPCKNHTLRKTATLQRTWLPGLLHSYLLSTGNCEVHNETEDMDHLKEGNKIDRTIQKKCKHWAYWQTA